VRFKAVPLPVAVFVGLALIAIEVSCSQSALSPVIRSQSDTYQTNGQSTQSQLNRTSLDEGGRELSPDAGSSGTPTPIACAGGSAGLTVCYQLAPGDSTTVSESSSDIFCFGNPMGTWFLATPVPSLAYSFNPAVTILCGQTNLTLTTPPTNPPSMVTYVADPMIGANPGFPDVTIKVPNNCVCYAAEIQGAANAHPISGMSPLLLAAVAAQESSSGCYNCGNAAAVQCPSTPSLCGQGLFQIDPGGGIFLSNYYDPWQSANAAADNLAGCLDVYNGDIAKALHCYNRGYTQKAEDPTSWPCVGDSPTYTNSVLRHLTYLNNANLGFACANGDIVDDLAFMTLPQDLREKPLLSYCPLKRRKEE
jgi:hypothetical protein